MLHEGVIAGISAYAIENWTWGEVCTQIIASLERERRRNQELAAVAVGGAQYVARYLCGGQVPELAEVFPFWTDEERNEMKVNKYRKMMERIVRGGAKNA